MSGFEKIGILGGGAWGTALALVAARPNALKPNARRLIKLWAYETGVVEEINAQHRNSTFLPGVTLPAEIEASHELSSLRACDLILAVVPAQHLRSITTKLAPFVAPNTLILACSKGIEQGTQQFCCEILRETLPDCALGVLSGPSFAIDVAQGLPTAVTLASPDRALGERAAHALGTPTFRPYWTDDVMGAEIGGAVKNVLAIACGIVEELGLGRSAHAALIARGFAEMSRLATRLGARAETVSGLSGLGDLVLTCSSTQSRNMSFGRALASGQRAGDLLAATKSVVEGVQTAPALLALMRKLDVDMPIAATIASLLKDELTVSEAVKNLMSRPLRAEHGG